ncbi:MAG: aminoglycoside phosphotransferase family protein, partial [Nitrospirota bacterium]
HIKKNLHYKNCILGPGLKINLNESEIFRLSENDNRQLIGTGGSERTYYRVKINNKRAVLMQCKNNDPDFERHIEYTKFFLKHSIPIPKLIEVSAHKRSAIFQDLGDLSLYSWLKCPRKQKQIENIYKQVIDILILIHTGTTEHVSECPALQNRVFDYEHFQWETNYFIERFVRGIKNVQVKNLSALNKEFHSLAIKADSFPKTIIHRDFQSQNIMITKGNVPRLIDYQGARMGPPAYDVVSILWDPYCRLGNNMRERLIDYYIDKMKVVTKNTTTLPYIPSHPRPRFAERGGQGRGEHKKQIPSPLAPACPARFAARRVGRGEGQGEGDRQIIWDNPITFDGKYFRDSLLPCRLQRHMQALGAYGFLSAVKGKKYFLTHVPEGLRLLKEDALLAKKEYPALHKLVMKL